MDRRLLSVVVIAVLIGSLAKAGIVGDKAKRLEYMLMIKNGKPVYREYVMLSVSHGYKLVERMEKIAGSQNSDISNLTYQARNILYNISLMNITRESLPEVNRQWDSFKELLVEASRTIIRDRIIMDIGKLREYSSHATGMERELVDEKISRLEKLAVDIKYLDPWVVGEKANRILNENRAVIIDSFEAYGNGTVNISLDAGVIELRGKGSYWAKGGDIDDSFEKNGYVRVEGQHIALNFTGTGKVFARGIGVAYISGSGYYKSSYDEGPWPVDGWKKVVIAGD